jgi:hypothetical protein
MINLRGQLVCSSCRLPSPAGTDYLDMLERARDSGWTTVTTNCEGTITLHHFCPRCRAAATGLLEEAETQG